MSQSPIFIKTEAFSVWLLNHTRSFPRIERFRLGKRIEDALFTFHFLLIDASLRTDYTQQTLVEADIYLTQLKALLRLARELGYTSASQYAYCAEYTAELGKLLGGWLKSLTASTKP